MVINDSINRRNKEPKILKKGGQIMQKNLFKKILCFTIALLMLMPSMPGNTVSAAEIVNNDYVTVNTEHNTNSSGNRYMKVMVYVDNELMSNTDYRFNKNGSDKGPGDVTVAPKPGYTITSLYRSEEGNIDGGSEFTNGTNFSISSEWYNYRTLRIYLEANEPDEPEPTADDIELTKTATAVDGQDNTYEIQLSVLGENLVIPKKADVVLVLDNSNSMHDEDDGNGNSLAEITEDAAHAFIDGVLTGDNDNIRVAVVQYGTYARASRFYGNWTSYWSSGLDLDDVTVYTSNNSVAKAAVTSATTRFYYNSYGGTNTEGGFLMAQKVVGQSRADAESIVIFMTDGMPTYRYNSSGDAVSDSYGDQTSQEELNEAIAAAQALDTTSDIYTIALLSAYSRTSNEAKLAANLLSTSPKTYLYDANNVKEDVNDLNEWAPATSYTQAYYPIFSDDDASEEIEGIYENLADTVRALATGYVEDTIPQYFQLTPDSVAELEEAGATVIENVDGTTTITFPDVRASATITNLHEYTVVARPGYYGTAYTNKDENGNSAIYHYTLNTSGNESGAKEFPQPVVAINPTAADDSTTAAGDYYTAHMNVSLEVNEADGILKNDGTTILNEDNYIISPLRVHSSYVGVNITTAANGVVVVNEDGSFVYTPVSGFTGEDSFTYKNFVNVSKTDGALNGDYESNLATVTINVFPKLTYNANGGTGEMNDKFAAVGTVFDLDENLFTREGYTFEGWSTTAAGTVEYADEASFTMPAGGDTLYAIWVENEAVTITYEAGTGGTVSRASESLAPVTGTAQGSTATAITGYHFVNWTVKGIETVAGTNEVLSTAEVDAIAKTGGIYAATTFVANFKEDAEEKIEINVRKFWVDSANLIQTSEMQPMISSQSVQRPDNIVLNLVDKNGNVAGSITLSYEDGWSGTFVLPKYDIDNNEIDYSEYTIEENILDNYISVVENWGLSDGFGVYNIEAINIPVTKVWNGPEADEVTITLLDGDGESTEYSLELNDDNDWKGSFKLPKYEILEAPWDFRGIDYTDYTISELEIEGYDVEITGSFEEGFTVTNTAQNVEYIVNYWEIGNEVPMETVTGSGIYGSQVTEVAKNFPGFNKVGQTEKTITLGHGDNVIDFYYTEVEVIAADKYVINWNYEDGFKTRDYEKEDTTGVLEDSEVEHDGDGIDIQHYVDLGEKTGYTYFRYEQDSVTVPEYIEVPVTTGSSITGTAITGTAIKYVTTTTIDLLYNMDNVTRNIEVTKIWSGGSASNRPSITINLLADGVKVGEIVLTNGNTTHTFTVPRYNEETGSAINYTITENSVANYRASINGFTVTNTYTGGGGGGGGGGGTIIEEPEVPLAELEKFDHFAYIIGYPEGDVRPLNNITREEVAMIFYRLLTDESRDALLSDANPFTDMQGHDWSNRAISTLYNAGILAGYPDGTFRPSDPISRAEFATIAAKFDELELENTTKFTDITGHWAEKYITSAEIKGWVNGYPDMTFKPEQDITRAESMTLVNNVLERAVPEENIHPDAMFWPDMTSDDWYYEAVMEATNSHNYMYEEDGDELWTEMKANKVWP